MSGVKIAVLGECMLEISLAAATPESPCGQLPANLSFGGDVLNTAVYLSRLGCPVDFVTAVGDDKMSQWLVDQWQREGVGCSLVQRMVGQSAGLYMISTDAEGERSFSYWRSQAPARQVFDDGEKAQQLFDLMGQYEWLYFTGISLAILPAPARQGFLDFIVEYRAAGGKVAFDSNFRQRLWPDVDEARGLYNQVYALTDMALLTLEDEQALFGAGSLALHQQRLKQFGIGELVLKQGPEGCLIDHNGEQVHVAAQRVRAVDTTSAGDSFNAGYLAERIAGKAPLQAAKTAHGLAALVVQHQGAIVPRNVTDSLSKSLND